jgi:tRNA-specific 2-thiouridylase
LKPITGDVIEIPANLEQFLLYSSELKNIEHTNLEKLSQPFSYNPSMGSKVASHQGAHFYTIGQRKGLYIGGRPEPSFVISIDTVNNIVYTGQTENHPGLNRIALKLQVNSLKWINRDCALLKDNTLEVMARIRYRQPLQPARLIKVIDDYYLLFNDLQRGITPGQFAAWYINDELIGSAVILH